MNAVAILPVKRFAEAKRRLSAGIDDERREAIVAAMAADVLEAISGSRAVATILVVSDEPRIARLARGAGAELIADPGGGHVAAAGAGIARALELGAGPAVLLPGDCPLLEPRRLDSLLTGLPTPFVTIVPDRHGTGTNALVLDPPDAIAPAFGEGSLKRHVEIARRAGIPYAVEEVAELALDLDTPADLIALTRELERDRDRARRTARALGV